MQVFCIYIIVSSLCFMGFLCVCLFCSILLSFSFILFYYHFLDVCFLMREKESVDLDGRGGGESLRWGRGNYNQNIV